MRTLSSAGASVSSSCWRSGLREKADTVFCRASLDRENGTDLPVKTNRHHCGLAEAARYVRQDAMLVSAAAQNMDVRARNDLTLLAREFLKLDVRARQNIATIGLKVLQLDARARERAEKKVGRLSRMATKFTEIAGTELKTAASEHWSDGALEADLRMADLRARRRAMEDSYAAIQAVRSIHDATVKVLLMKARTEDSEVEGLEVESRDSSLITKVAEFEKAYSSMASLSAEVDALELGDPDELEYIVATLLDLDEVDGAHGASLVTESANSPDTATRRALADALANAPSLWTLGNAGISALQKLAEDNNSEVAAAASDALRDLEKQWQQLDHNTSFKLNVTKSGDVSSPEDSGPLFTPSSYFTFQCLDSMRKLRGCDLSRGSAQEPSRPRPCRHIRPHPFTELLKLRDLGLHLVDVRLQLLVLANNQPELERRFSGRCSGWDVGDTVTRC